MYVDLGLRPHPGLERGGRIVTIGQLEDVGLRGLPAELIERMNEEMTSLDGVAARSRRRSAAFGNTAGIEQESGDVSETSEDDGAQILATSAYTKFE